MRLLNNKGIALITVLMLTLITLVIILGILTLITNNTKLSGARKTYRNVTEAAYGGADLVMQDIIPRAFTNFTNFSTVIKSDYSAIEMQLGSSACLRQKLKNDANDWAACSGMNNNPKTQPDMTFKLNGASGQSFTVYSKIIDTTPGVPYPSAPSGGQLIGGGVAESSSGTTTNLSHYVYRIEVAGEQTVNPSEMSNISVLYEY
jgi:hypothetical protein